MKKETRWKKGVKKEGHLQAKWAREDYHSFRPPDRGVQTSEAEGRHEEICLSD